MRQPPPPAVAVPDADRLNAWLEDGHVKHKSKSAIPREDTRLFEPQTQHHQNPWTTRVGISLLGDLHQK